MPNLLGVLSLSNVIVEKHLIIFFCIDLKVLVVLDSLGALPRLFQCVRDSWCGVKLERSPVAWIDGIARSVLRDFVGCDKTASKTDCKTPTKVVVVSPPKIDTSSSAWPPIPGTSKGTVALVAPVSKRRLLSPVVERLPSPTSVTETGAVESWSPVSSEFDVWAQRSTSSCSRATSGRPSSEKMAEFSLFSTSVAAYFNLEAPSKCAPEPPRISGEAASPGILRGPPGIPAPHHLFGPPGIPASTASKPPLPPLSSVVSVLDLDVEAVEALAQSRVSETAILLDLKHSDLINIGLKKGPAVRIWAWATAARARGLGSSDRSL